MRTIAITGASGFIGDAVARRYADAGWQARGLDQRLPDPLNPLTPNADPRVEYLVGDVTHLEALSGPYDFSFDVGCFHCLDPNGQRAYASEVFRLLKPGGVHLIWALDESPSDLQLSPAAIENVFASGFQLQASRSSRRRLVRSHWYWLVRASE